MAEENQNTPEITNIKSVTNWEQRLHDNEKTAAFDQESVDTFQKEFLADNTSTNNEVKPQNPTPTPKQSGGGFWFFVLMLAFCISAACGVYLTIHPGAVCAEAHETAGSVIATSKNKSTEGIAWIKVRGVIAEEDNNSPWNAPSGASYISKRVREAAKDDRVKAIVLDINSPGGTVASVQDIYSEILAAKEKGKKVVALFRDVAASGAFYIAMAADQIVAEPGTITGSVGVIMQAGNVVGLFDKLGIKVNPVTSGKYKDIGSAYRPMTADERALLQDMVDDTYSQFLEAVRTGRPNVKPADLTEYTDGRVFTGQRAFKLGFVDKLGGEETARALAGELAGLEDPKIISRRGNNLREILFSVGSGMDSKNLSKQLQSMSTPTVSYLWVF